MLKKMISLLIAMAAIPYVLVFLFSLFSEEIQIGKGNHSLKNKYMRKEILIETGGLYRSIDVEEYVVGVLAGTIPADYDSETLKVQAILIRTNILKEMQEKNTTDAADLSYQYLTVEERIMLWGERNYELYEKRFEAAVAYTAGKVIKQENSLIMALYHEVSIGKTASAKEILGEDISYLQSVESNRDVEAKHYMNMVNFTWKEFAEKMNETGEKTNEKADEKEQATEEKTTLGKASVQIEESSENGFVKKVSVDGTVFSGEELMKKLGLTSVNFYVEEVEDGLRFVCLGKGSCLGLSQYGANCMALDGKKTDEIIKYYYKNVSITDYKE